MTRDMSNGRVLACVVMAYSVLLPEDERVSTALGSLSIAAEALWAQMDDNARQEWLDRWDEISGDDLRGVLPRAYAYYRAYGGLDDEEGA